MTEAIERKSIEREEQQGRMFGEGGLNAPVE
jgi:hypothetical protein